MYSLLILSFVVSFFLVISHLFLLIKLKSSFGLKMISFFFLMGLELKLYLKYFISGNYVEPTGSFDFTTESYLKVLSIIMIVRLVMIAITIVNSKFMVFNSRPVLMRHNLSDKTESYLFFTFFILAGSFAIINYSFSISQIGIPSPVTLPFKLNAILFFIIVVGSSGLFSYLVSFSRRADYYLIFYFLIAFGNSISILSRSLYLVQTVVFLLNIKRFKNKSMIILVWGSLFVSSYVTAQVFRLYMFDRYVFLESAAGGEGYKTSGDSMTTNILGRDFVRLMTNRWMGLEGVMAVVSFPKTDMALFYRATIEVPSHHLFNVSEFEKVANSKYGNYVTLNAFHSLPGVVGYLLMSGSILFMIGGLIVLVYAGLLSESLIKYYFSSPLLAQFFCINYFFNLSQAGIYPVNLLKHYIFWAIMMLVLFIVKKTNVLKISEGLNEA